MMSLHWPAIAVVALSLGVVAIGSRLALAIRPVPMIDVFPVPLPDKLLRRFRRRADLGDPSDFRSLRHWLSLFVIMAVLLGLFLLAIPLLAYGNRSTGSMPWFNSMVGRSAAALGAVYFLSAVLKYQRLGRLGRYACYGLLVIASVGWVLWPTWVTSDIMAALEIVVFVMAGQLRWSFGRLLVLCMVVAVAFDVIQVLVTKQLPGLIEAGAMPSDGMLMIVSSRGERSGIGFGDVVFPALLVVAAGRVGQRTGAWSLYWVALIGYAAGAITAMAATYLHQYQPGLIYLIPAVAIAVIVAARRRGLGFELMNRPQWMQ